MPQTYLIHAADAANRIVMAINVDLPSPEAESGAMPREIQWMPPGRHEIHATRNGEPAKIIVNVDEAAAQAVAQSFADLQASGRRPYLDFNHESAEASATVASVFWGGDDPKKGGIRCLVDWTQPGKEALEGRAYFSFSPTFLLDKEGKINGTTTNMGGLVNEPAFTAIAPVTGKESDTDTMKELLKALAEAGIISAASVSEEDAVAAVKAHTAKAKEDNEALQAKLAKAEEQVQAAEKRRAEDLVKAAVAAGKINPKDDKVQAFYRAAIMTTGADAEAALEALPVQAKFQTEVRVQAGEAAKDEPAPQGPETFEAAAKAIAAERKIDESEAFTIAASEKPALYDAYVARMRGEA